MKKLTSIRLTCAAVFAVALASLGFVGSASAQGEWDKFDNCPTSNPKTFKCLYSLTTGGKVVLGKKSVPIVNPVTLQGGYTEATKESEFVAEFIGASNGVTLSKTPQPVPGGLAGLVNCKEISNFLVRLGCESVFENGLTGVNATLELARPASEIRISEVNLLSQEGVALRMPVKVHLENPLLGSNCYVGSSSNPLIWNLTTGTSGSLKGTKGKIKLIEEEEILLAENAILVDNTWSAPGATGCGGPIVELLINPIINSQVGLPAGPGVNAAELITSNYIAPRESVEIH